MSYGAGYTLSEQITKYALKYNADNVKAVLTAIHDTIMVPRYQGAIVAVRANIDRVKAILAERGLPIGVYGVCVALGEVITKLLFKHTGASLIAAVNGVKQRFIALGCPADVAEAIVSALVPITTYY
jgi:hypothetical protein